MYPSLAAEGEIPRNLETGFDVSRLSNDELAKKLRSCGVRVGPIVGSTRRLYEKKLVGLLAGGRRDRPAPPVVDEFSDDCSDGDELGADGPRVGEPAPGASAIRRRLPGGTDEPVADLAAKYPDLGTLVKEEADQPHLLRDGTDTGGRDIGHGSVSAEVGGRHEKERRPWVRRGVKLFFLVMLVGLCCIGYYEWQRWAALLEVLVEAGRAAVGSLPAAAPVAPPPPVAPVAPRGDVLKHP
ncbi:uncharacterized protein LOC119092055 [Pollicipes pollicipes]|uniref:uncharacterized protein LOC119092055 n=1 Tax=Pollicipes pollicipes TaxID=41117 RepID=UPI0018855913|nr:uncharacterized protein LOC119092055 [Pollicipes pollicipes]